MFEIQRGIIYLPNAWIETLWKKYIKFNQHSVAEFEIICERNDWTIVEMVHKVDEIEAREQYRQQPILEYYDIFEFQGVHEALSYLLYEKYKQNLKKQQEQEIMKQAKLGPPKDYFIIDEFDKIVSDPKKDKYKPKSVFQPNWHKKKFKYGE